MDAQNCLQDMMVFCLPRKEGVVALDKIVLCGNKGFGMQDCHWLGLGCSNNDDYLLGGEVEALCKTVLH